MEDIKGNDAAFNAKALREVVEGKHDDIPEQCFYMAGGIEEVLERAEKLKAEGK